MNKFVVYVLSVIFPNSGKNILVSIWKHIQSTMIWFIMTDKNRNITVFSL